MLFLAAATLAAVWYLFRFTTLGRRLLATGGNEKAAKMAAVDTDRMQLIANILSGLFAAVAGICAVSMNGAAQPTTGQDWMIYSFAVSVIGGTALAGGVICPIGIAIAAFLVVIIKNGLVMLNANISIVHQEIQVIPEATVAENIVLDKLDTFRSRLGRLDWKRINATAQKYLQIVELDVAPTQIIKGMTAAQKQLIQIAKALSADARYILLDEPTIGVDIGAKYHIHKLIWDLAEKQGKSIILISSDMTEMVTLARRILVFKDYQIVDEIDGLNDREHSYQELSERIGQAVS